MDEVGIAVRESRIKELELEVRQLYEQLAVHEDAVQLHKDAVVAVQEERNRDYKERVTAFVEPREARIVELERENNALRVREAEAMAFARRKQDQYDELCTKIGAEA